MVLGWKILASAAVKLERASAGTGRWKRKRKQHKVYIVKQEGKSEIFETLRPHIYVVRLKQAIVRIFATAKQDDESFVESDGRLVLF